MFLYLSDLFRQTVIFLKSLLEILQVVKWWASAKLDTRPKPVKLYDIKMKLEGKDTIIPTLTSERIEKICRDADKHFKPPDQAFLSRHLCREIRLEKQLQYWLGKYPELEKPIHILKEPASGDRSLPPLKFLNGVNKLFEYTP